MGRFRTQMFINGRSETNFFQLNETLTTAVAAQTGFDWNYILQKKKHLIKIVFDQIGTCHADMCFSKITTIQNVFKSTKSNLFFDLAGDNWYLLKMLRFSLMLTSSFYISVNIFVTQELCFQSSWMDQLLLFKDMCESIPLFKRIILIV